MLGVDFTQTRKMLHALNFVVVVIGLLPTLTSSSSLSNSRWKAMYQKLQAGYQPPQSPIGAPSYACCNYPATTPQGTRLPPPPRVRGYPLRSMIRSIELLDDRSDQLRRTLEELSRLRSEERALSDLPALPPADSLALLPLAQDDLPSRKRGVMLTRLVGPRPGFLSQAASSSSQREPLPLFLGDTDKRQSGFVVRRKSKGGAPGSAGGPNIGDCPSECRICYRYPHQSSFVWRCSR